MLGVVPSRDVNSLSNCYLDKYKHVIVMVAKDLNNRCMEIALSSALGPTCLEWAVKIFY